MGSCPTISHMYFALSTKWMSSPSRKWGRFYVSLVPVLGSCLKRIFLCFFWFQCWGHVCKGSCLKIPSNFNKLLKIPSFNSSLLDFLLSEYENPEYASVIREKEFYCSIDNKYRKFLCVDGSLKFETVTELFGDHLESDTRVMLHADTKGPGNIIIQGNDTDIFTILLANVQKLLQSYLWFDTEFDSDNPRNYADLSKLSKELE